MNSKSNKFRYLSADAHSSVCCSPQVGFKCHSCQLSSAHDRVTPRLHPPMTPAPTHSSTTWQRSDQDVLASFSYSGRKWRRVSHLCLGQCLHYKTSVTLHRMKKDVTQSRRSPSAGPCGTPWSKRLDDMDSSFHRIIKHCVKSLVS